MDVLTFYVKVYNKFSRRAFVHFRNDFELRCKGKIFISYTKLKLYDRFYILVTIVADEKYSVYLTLE